MAGYRCRCCGEFHDEVPMHYGAPAPELWFTLPEGERDERAELSSDVCLIDGEHAFVVGNLEIPVAGCDDPFSWDVWVSVSLESLRRMGQLWDTPGRESEPPCFGWISTSLPCYPETLNLKAMVHTREVGQRPRIELEPTDHPLAVEQRTGIDLARVQQIAEQILHSSP